MAAARRSTSEEFIRVVNRLTPARLPFILIVAIGAAVAKHRTAANARVATGGVQEWAGYFVRGSELLFGVHHSYSKAAGGLHLYANYHELQIGPLALVVAAPLRVIGSDQGLLASAVVMTIMGLAMIVTLERTATTAAGSTADTDRLARIVLVGGAVTMAAWAELSSAYGHLDDALVMAFVVGALVAVIARRPLAIGILIGLAVAAKPWAVAFAPLILALEPRLRRSAALAMVGVSAAAWLPFVVADRHTLSAGRPAVDTDASSVLHLLGLPLGQGPWWVRPLQLSVAVVLGVIAVRMGRWTAAPLVAITTRIVLDPAVLTYYVSGLLVAALAWDLLGSEQQFPVTVVAAFVAFDVVDPAIGSPTVRAVVRLVACVALIGWVLRPRRDRASSTEPVVVPS